MHAHTTQVLILGRTGGVNGVDGEAFEVLQQRASKLPLPRARLAGDEQPSTRHGGVCTDRLHAVGQSQDAKAHMWGEQQHPPTTTTAHLTYLQREGTAVEG